MIKSTLRFVDVEDIPGLLPLPRRFKGHVCGQENRVGDGLGTRLGLVLVYNTMHFRFKPQAIAYCSINDIISLCFVK